MLIYGSVVNPVKVKKLPDKSRAEKQQRPRLISPWINSGALRRSLVSATAQCSTIIPVDQWPRLRIGWEFAFSGINHLQLHTYAWTGRAIEHIFKITTKLIIIMLAFKLRTLWAATAGFSTRESPLFGAILTMTRYHCVIFNMASTASYVTCINRVCEVAKNKQTTDQQ